MRAFLQSGLVFLALSATAAPAFGKKPPKDAPAETSTTEAPADAKPAPPEMVIQKTGVAAVDDVFVRADAPIGTLKSIRMDMASLHTNVTSAMGLPAGTPIADAVADLKAKAGDKMSVAMDEHGLPHITPTDALPENLKAAVDAVNGGVGQIESSMTRLHDVPGQLKELMVAASALKTETFTQSGVSPTEIPKKAKTLQHNVQVLRTAATEADAIRAELEGMKTGIQASLKAM